MRTFLVTAAARILDPDLLLRDDSSDDNGVVKEYREHITFCLKQALLSLDDARQLIDILDIVPSRRAPLNAVADLCQQNFDLSLNETIARANRRLFCWPRAVRMTHVTRLEASQIEDIRKFSRFSDDSADSDDPISDEGALRPLRPSPYMLDAFFGFVDSLSGQVLAFMAYTFMLDPFGNVFAYIRYTETRSESIGQEKYTYGAGLADILARILLSAAKSVRVLLRLSLDDD